MRMNAFSNYAIRVLMYAALRSTPESVPEIARAYGVSYDHLRKVVAVLTRLGHIKTVRGRDGGVQLARRPEDIGIGDVVRATEGDIVLVECFDLASSTCPLEPACRLKLALAQALGAFFAVLDRYTLADLVAAPQELSPLLGLDGEPREAERQAAVAAHDGEPSGEGSG